MYIFVLIVVEASGQPYVQNFVTKLATSPPWGTVGHNSERPLGFPRPSNRGQRSGLKVVSWGAAPAHSFIIAVWGFNWVLSVRS